jgi:PAS domain S-box-containing protein
MEEVSAEKNDSYLSSVEYVSLVEKVLKVTGIGLSIIDSDYNLKFLNESWKETCGDYRDKKCYEYLRKLDKICDGCNALNMPDNDKACISEEFFHHHSKTYEVIRQPFEMHDGEKLLAEVYMDITERKKAEEKAFTMSSVVEQSPSSIVITDTSGDIEYVNSKFTELTGYTMEEVKGKNPNILKSGETHPDVYKILWNTIKEGKEWRGEFHNKKKNGEFYWEFASISPLRDLNGTITHFLAIKEDITDRKKIEEELRLAKNHAEVVNRLKSQILASISHELRTPMNSILGISKLLINKSSDNLNEKQIKGLSMINESGEKLLSYIDHILEIARLEAGKTELILEIFSLEEMIADIEGFIRHIKKDNISFIITRDKGLPVSIFSDRKKIIQILVNFLSNSVKFTSSGKIEFKISMKDEAVIFSVHDTGTGISSENLSCIFEDFKYFDEGQLTGYKRIKRGLTISKKLSILLQGDIIVESEPGTGSTFSFIIPYFKI